MKIVLLYKTKMLNINIIKKIYVRNFGKKNTFQGVILMRKSLGLEENLLKKDLLIVQINQFIILL